MTQKKKREETNTEHKTDELVGPMNAEFYRMRPIDLTQP